jgi:hypothetical protein
MTCHACSQLCSDDPRLRLPKERFPVPRAAAAGRAQIQRGWRAQQRVLRESRLSSWHLFACFILRFLPPLLCGCSCCVAHLALTFFFSVQPFAYGSVSMTANECSFPLVSRGLLRIAGPQNVLREAHPRALLWVSRLCFGAVSLVPRAAGVCLSPLCLLPNVAPACVHERKSPDLSRVLAAFLLFAGWPTTLTTTCRRTLSPTPTCRCTGKCCTCSWTSSRSSTSG